MGDPTSICFFLPTSRSTKLEAKMGGGSELALFYLCNALSKMGLEVHVVIDEGHKRDYTLGNVWVHSHTIPNNPVGSYLSTLRRLSRLHEIYRFEMIVDFEQSLQWRKTFCGDAVVRFAEKNGIPLVYYFGNHIPWLIPKSQYDPWLVWRTLRKVVYCSQKVIAASSVLARAVVSKMGVSEDRVDVVPFGVDLERYRRKDGFRRDTKRVVFVGRIVPHKGLEDLVDAAALLKNEGFSFTVIGPRGGWWDDVPSQFFWSIVERAKRAGVEETVRFTGSLPREKLVEEMWASNVFCFPTHIEGFGVALVEALAAGLTPVVWDIEPMNEIVGDAGIKAKPFDTKSLAEGIVKAASDASLKTLVEKRAEDFDASKVAKMFLKSVSEVR